ncbi:hypothetical protein J1614_012046 [Plenodomus biglobosus]|nr:hypothetical protein J1614_012046 [Plenodomus biglobosus]
MTFGGLTETRAVVWLPAYLESAASERRQRRRWHCQELDYLVMRCGEMRKWLMGAKEGAQGLGSERSRVVATVRRGRRGSTRRGEAWLAFALFLRASPRHGASRLKRAWNRFLPRIARAVEAGETKAAG